MKTDSFFKTCISLVSTPVYIVFAIVLIIYAVVGSLAEAALVLLMVLFDVAAKAFFRIRTEKVFGCSCDRQESKNRFLTVGHFNTVILIISVVSAVLAVPLLIIGLVNPGDGGAGYTLARVLAAFALILSMLYTKDGSAMEYSIVRHLSDGNSGTDKLKFRDVDSLQRIASADTAVILNPAVLYDRKSEVREVFFDSAVYRGMSLGESELSVPAERAYFLSLLALCCAESGFKIIPSHEDAFDRFNSDQCMSKTSFYLSAKRMDPYPDYPAKGDITVFTLFNGFNNPPVALTRSVSMNSVNICEYCRRNDGIAVSMTEFARNCAINAVNSLVRRGLSPYIIISSDYTNNRNGRLIRPVLEAIIGVGGAFPETNSDVASALNDYGVRPVLVMPDSKASFINFANECGIADGPEDVAFFEGNNDFIEYSDARKAYIGYRDESVITLLKSMKQQGRRPLCILRNSHDLSTLSEAEASVAVTGAADKEVLSVADTTVPAATQSPEDGLGALFGIVTLASSAVAKIGMLRNIFFAFSIDALISIIISLILPSVYACPSCLQLLFACAVTAISSSLILARDKLITRNINSVLYNSSAEKKRYVKYLGLGALLSVALITVGMLFFKDSGAEMRKYVSMALPLSGVALIEAERLFRRKSYGISGINLVSLIVILVSLLLTLSFAFIRGSGVLEYSFGNTDNPLRTFAISLIPGLVPFVYLLIADLIRNAVKEENENNL